MTARIELYVVPVTDLPRARTLYRTLLGVEPYVDEPYYAGFRAGDQEIGLDPNGHRNGASAPVAYFRVDDIGAALQGLLEAGATPQQDVRDVGGGKHIASVTDADGNTIALVQSP